MFVERWSGSRTRARPGTIRLEVFGGWKTVFRRFSRWGAKQVWWHIFEALSDDPDVEYLIVDSTIVRAHQIWAEIL